MSLIRTYKPTSLEEKKVNTTIPMMFSDQQLREMSDEKLEGIARNFKNKIEMLRRKGDDSHPFEVEYCYVKRELEFRNKRREIQALYAQKKTRYTAHNANYRKPRHDVRMVVPVSPNEITVTQ